MTNINESADTEKTYTDIEVVSVLFKQLDMIDQEWTARRNSRGVPLEMMSATQLATYVREYENYYGQREGLLRAIQRFS